MSTAIPIWKYFFIVILPSSMSSIEQLKFGYFFKAATNDLIIKTKGVIFFFYPVFKSFKEDLNSSRSVISASSWCVT